MSRHPIHIGARVAVEFLANGSTDAVITVAVNVLEEITALDSGCTASYRRPVARVGSTPVVGGSVVAQRAVPSKEALPCVRPAY